VITPIPDETDLRTKSRDDLVRMILEISVARVHLEQRCEALEESATMPAPAGPDERDERIAALETELADARAELAKVGDADEASQSKTARSSRK